MGTFLPAGAQITRFNTNPTSLEQAIANLTPAAKQAMFSAATHGLIKRRTWDGCAFNKAGLEIGADVSTSTVAAEKFGCSVKAVNDFITIWDGLSGSDSQATAQLREAIEKVGLFTEPSSLKKMAYVVRSRVFTSYETKMREEFDKTNADAPIEGAAEMGKILSATAC